MNLYFYSKIRFSPLNSFLVFFSDFLKREIQMTLSHAFAYRGCHLFYLATETKGLAFDKKPTYKGGHIML